MHPDAPLQHEAAPQHVSAQAFSVRPRTMLCARPLIALSAAPQVTRQLRPGHPRIASLPTPTPNRRYLPMWSRLYTACAASYCVLRTGLMNTAYSSGGEGAPPGSGPVMSSSLSPSPLRICSLRCIRNQ